MNKTLHQDDSLMKSLEIKTINRLICYTDKGMLTLQIRKGDTQYHICLDSVPLDKEKNKELMELLFPAPQSTIPQVTKLSFNGMPITPDKVIVSKKITKSKGRPKGSKNR